MSEVASLAQFLHGLDSPMYVVTARHRDKDDLISGCLVSYATSCSLRPERFLACLSIPNHTYRVATEADFLAVHSLEAGHREIARLFGTRTGDEVDKFAECRWHPGLEGVPILDDVPKYFVGEIVDRLPLGDHVGFLLAPVEFALPDRELPLTFSSVTHWTAGHPG